jgi:sulfite reductase alpha subunit-like flavoprotein
LARPSSHHFPSARHPVFALLSITLNVELSIYSGIQLRIGITKGLLTLPQDLSTPVICIAPGTGVAPARAVLEARVQSGARNNTLYFGHRASGKDAHYAREWTSLAESGHLTYRVAVSRDGPEGTRRVYAQDIIRRDAKRIWELVHDSGAWLYISGCVHSIGPSWEAYVDDI